jgi:hypothetical protein
MAKFAFKEFSEVHIQDPAKPHPATPENTLPGTLHSPAPIPLVTPMDRYARSWMFFLQTNVCTSERTPHAPSLMLQVAGRGHAELLRTLTLRSSVNKDHQACQRPSHHQRKEPVPQGGGLTGLSGTIASSYTLAVNRLPTVLSEMSSEDTSPTVLTIRVASTGSELW